MRKKTPQKRLEILNIASRLFLKQGFEKVSMTYLATQVGGSKATLYNYFHNKEEIFSEVILLLASKLKKDAFDVLEQHIDFKEKVILFGLKHLNFILSPQVTSIRRLVMLHSYRKMISQTLYEKGFKQGWKRFESVLHEATQQNLLKKDINLWKATMHFKGLLEADLLERSILCPHLPISQEEQEENATMAFGIFWQYYGCDGGR